MTAALLVLVQLDVHVHDDVVLDCDSTCSEQPLLAGLTDVLRHSDAQLSRCPEVRDEDEDKDNR